MTTFYNRQRKHRLPKGVDGQGRHPQQGPAFEPQDADAVARQVAEGLGVAALLAALCALLAWWFL